MNGRHPFASHRGHITPSHDGEVHSGMHSEFLWTKANSWWKIKNWFLSKWASLSSSLYSAEQSITESCSSWCWNLLINKFKKLVQRQKTQKYPGGVLHPFLGQLPQRTSWKTFVLLEASQLSYSPWKTTFFLCRGVRATICSDKPLCYVLCFGLLWRYREHVLLTKAVVK